MAGPGAGGSPAPGAPDARLVVVLVRVAERAGLGALKHLLLSDRGGVGLTVLGHVAVLEVRSGVRDLGHLPRRVRALRILRGRATDPADRRVLAIGEVAAAATGGRFATAAAALVVSHGSACLS